MKTSSILKIGLLAVLAGVLSGCRCSGGGSSETKVKEAARSTKEHPIYRDIDWSKYVYQVSVGDRSYGYTVSVDIDEVASGRKFEEKLEMYDVVSVPCEGTRLLFRVTMSGKSVFVDHWQVGGLRPDTPPGDQDFDWEPFRQYGDRDHDWDGYWKREHHRIMHPEE